MKTKWILTAMAALALGFVALNMTGCKTTEPSNTSSSAVKYACPMHPEVVQDTTGNCPKCGMALVEKK